MAVENPDALRGLHREFLAAGAQVLQALTFFGTREKLDRAGFGGQTEAINAAAVRLAKEVAGDAALVAGSVSRTQLFEREGPGAAGHVRDRDLEVNVCRKKHLTNIRSSTAEEALRLEAPRVLSLDDAIEYIGDDELVEVTPKSFRLRKKLLSADDRKREQKKRDMAMAER